MGVGGKWGLWGWWSGGGGVGVEEGERGRGGPTNSPMAGSEDAEMAGPPPLLTVLSIIQQGCFLQITDGSREAREFSNFRYKRYRRENKVINLVTLSHQVVDTEKDN